MRFLRLVVASPFLFFGVACFFVGIAFAGETSTKSLLSSIERVNAKLNKRIDEIE